MGNSWVICLPGVPRHRLGGSSSAGSDSLMLAGSWVSVCHRDGEYILRGRHVMIEPTPEFHPGFSEPTAGAVPWADVERILGSAQIFWLSTVRPDGRPHVTPLPAVWDSGALYICTGD